MASNAPTQEFGTDLGRAALLSLSAGMGCALVLSLLWLAIVWFNGTQPLPLPPP